MNLLSKLLHKKRLEKESFSARLQMEKDAQHMTAARLKAIEIAMKNDARVK